MPASPQTSDILSIYPRYMLPIPGLSFPGATHTTSIVCPCCFKLREYMKGGTNNTFIFEVSKNFLFVYMDYLLLKCIA
jgi:hypothetical protein